MLDPIAYPRLSLVIPFYNELDNVIPLFTQVHAGMNHYSGPWELICVDDGSHDGTASRLRHTARNYGAHVRVLCHRRNFGQTAAMQSGIDAARGELIVTLDGDLQNDPAEIPRLVRELLEQDLDLLSGWRKARYDPPLRSFLSRVANRLIARVTGVHLHDYGCSLKVYRGEVLRDIVLFGEMHRFIPVWLCTVTDPVRIAETVVQHHPRQFGNSKYGLSRTIRVLLDLLAAVFFLRYRARPGHFFGTIGLFLGTLGSILMAYLVTVKFGFGQSIGGRPLLFIAILLLVSAVQLLTTGVLAEMLSRVFFAASDRCIRPLTHTPPIAEADWKYPT